MHTKVFEQSVNYFGKVNVLLNNAGRSQRALFENIELKVDIDMFDLNVFFKKEEGGHIAVVSSIAGIIGAPYSATKHAIHVSILFTNTDFFIYNYNRFDSLAITYGYYLSRFFNKKSTILFVIL